jgi:endonuclease YncB( thermonuclease family)
MDENPLLSFTYENTPPFAFQCISPVAKVLSCHDGDTITVALKIPGFAAPLRHAVRLAEIDTPETTSRDIRAKVAALEARDRLVELLSGQKLATTTTTKCAIDAHFASHPSHVWLDIVELEKYGRILARVYPCGGGASRRPHFPSAGDILVSEGHAVSYFGGAKLTEAQMLVALRRA